MCLSYLILYPRLKLSELVNVAIVFMDVSPLPHSVPKTKTVSELVNVVTVFKNVSLLPHSVPQTEMSESAGRGYASVA